MPDKGIFERGPIEELEKSSDNNLRCDILESLSEQVLPLSDDVAAIHAELLRVIPEAILAARSTPTKSIETGFGSLPGRRPRDVLDAGIEILTTYRYLDVEGTLRALCRIWDGAGASERSSILAAVEQLAEHNIEAWRRVGCGVQAELMRVVGGMSAGELQAWPPIIVRACQHVLEPTIRGVTSSYDAETFHARAVPVDDVLRRVRSEALGVLEVLFAEAGTDDERRAAFSAMTTATEHPSVGSFGEDAITLATSNSSRVVRFVNSHYRGLSFELLQHFEHSFLSLYRQAPSWYQGCREEVKADGEALKGEIRRLCDAMNQDQDFITYKTLVGFESVFPHDWESDGFDVAEAHAWRLRQIDKFIEKINCHTASEWLAIIQRCAATHSNDAATFLTFSEFLKRLARAQPAIVLGYLQSVPVELEAFLDSFLAGLDDGASTPDAQALMRSWIEAGTYLRQIGRHLRRAQAVNEELVRALAAKATAIGNWEAVTEAVVVVLAHAELAAGGLVEEVFIPAVRDLTQRKDSRWLYDAPFLPTAPVILAALRPEQVSVVLDNLLEIPKIDTLTEPVIAALTEADYEGVWHFFGRRLERKADGSAPNRGYDAIPHQFVHAHAALGQNAGRAIDIVHSWYRADDTLFQFRGGRLVAIAFPEFPPALSEKLMEVLAAEGEGSLSFVAGILTHYHGDVATHPVCQAIVESLPRGDDRLRQVRNLLEGTGVVRGEFGMTGAYQRKIAEIEPWLEDSRPKVREFAQAHTKSMQQAVSAEHSRAEQDIALRKLEWGIDLDDDEA